MRLSDHVAGLRWRRDLPSHGHTSGTSPSASRLMVDAALVVAAVDVAFRTNGSGSLFAQLREASDLEAAGEAAGNGAATQDRERHDDARARGRRQPPLAASLWLSVVAGADGNAGRTPGRAVAGLRLERRDGRPLTRARTVIRESIPTVRRAVLKALWPHIPRDHRQVAALATLALTYAGVAVRAVDDERRSVADRVAGTRLVHVS